MPTVALETRALSKHFGAVRANDEVSLRLDRGEIVVVLGENGAGKSTLVQMLSGLLQPDGGEIMVGDEPRRLHSPAEAIAAGIGTVYQQLALVPTFTVREQLTLAGWSGSAGSLPFEPGVPLDATIESLALGGRQRVEIGRALLAARRVLLLDEPTSILAPSGIDQLFAALRRASDEREVAVMLITHKLHEALAIADRIIVLRRGRVVGERARAGAGWPPEIERDLLRLMFGEGTAGMEQSEAEPRAPMDSEPPVLTVSGLTMPARTGRTALDGIDFSLAAGTILVIVGIDGNGQRELAEALTGFLPAAAGAIRLDGVDVTGWPPGRLQAAGVAYLTDDRLGEGTVGTLTIAENLSLKELRSPGVSRFGMLRRGAMRAAARTAIRDYDIRPPDPDALVATLSGGNVQKLVLARELAGRPRLLIANKPTYGLDVQTMRAVHRALRRASAAGAGVLVFATEIEEALDLGDRIAVLRNGLLTVPVDRARISSSEIGALMAGQ